MTGMSERLELYVSLLVMALASSLVIAGSACGSRSSPEPHRVPAEPEVVEDDGPGPVMRESRPDPVAAKRKAEKMLHELLGDAEPEVRLQVLRFIRIARDTDWQERLLEMLEHEPDAEVQAKAAVTLAVLGSTDARELIRERYDAAEPALQVWYDKALALLRDKRAVRRLARQARSRDIEVAFVATLAVAELSQPGNKRAIDLLRRLARREIDLDAIRPFIGVEILARLAQLGYKKAREELHALLQRDGAGDEDLRLHAASGLASIGDDAGKGVLVDIVNDATSANRIAAGIVLVDLGDYSAAELLRDCATTRHEDRPLRRRCIESLGTIGDNAYLRELRRLYDEPDGTIRVAAAAAVLFVVGLEPRALAQESVDWVRSALRSGHPVQRRDATLALPNLPPAQSVPLLTAVVADEDPEVRRVAAQTASKLEGLAPAQKTQTARSVEAALVVEQVPAVKEAQIIALGKLADPAVAETLRDVAKDDDRAGTLAKGALIASLGDTGDAALVTETVEELDESFESGRTAIRLTVMESAVLARNRVVVPVLERGLIDRILDIRVAAAEGLTHYEIKSEAVLAVLQEASRATEHIAARATAVLVGLQVPVDGPGGAESSGGVSALLQSPDPEIRLKVVPAIAALPAAEAISRSFELLEDPEPAVRQASIDVVVKHARDHGDAVIPLLKKARHNSDPVTRVKAQAELAVLLATAKKKKAAQTPEPAAEEEPEEAKLDRDDKPAEPAMEMGELGDIEKALEEVQAAYNGLEVRSRAVRELAQEIAAHCGQKVDDDKDLDRAESLRGRLEKAHGEVVSARRKLAEPAAGFATATASLQERVDALAESDPVRVRFGELIERAATASRQAGLILSDSSKKTRERLEQLDRYLRDNEADPQIRVTSAETAISEGRLPSARRDLERAERAYERRKEENPRLQYVWGYYHDERAQQVEAGQSEKKDAKRRSDLARAKAHYERFIAMGQGFLVERVRERVAEIAAELGGEKTIEAPVPQERGQE